jgi:hypothetical protein
MPNPKRVTNMKTQFILKTLIICSLLLGSIGLHAQNPIDDFRGLEWGTKLSDVTFNEKEVQLEFYAEINNQERWYYRNNDDLTIGTAAVDQIYYVFDEANRFFKVVINGKASSNEEMHTVIQQRLGGPTGYRQWDRKVISSWKMDQVTLLFTEWRSKDYSIQIESFADEAYRRQINSEINDF